MTKLDLLTIGDSSIDLYMQIGDSSALEEDGFGEQPKMCFYHGSKIPVEKFQTSIAGNAVNVAVGAHLLGLNTAVYTETGDDENAERLVTQLKELGVSTEYIVKNRDTETDVHSVVVFKGERTIFSYHGKRAYTVKKWTPPMFIYYTSIGKNFESFQRELIAYIKQNQEVGVIFNPGTFQLKAGEEHLHPFLGITDILFLNKEEAGALTKSQSGTPVKELHTRLQELGPKLTIITDAERGASAYDRGQMVEQQAYSDSRPVSDKTGAGDAFASAAVTAIIYGKSIKEALKWGVLNSGNLIKEVGAINGLLTKQELERLVQHV